MPSNPFLVVVLFLKNLRALPFPASPLVADPTAAFSPQNPTTPPQPKTPTVRPPFPPITPHSFLQNVRYLPQPLPPFFPPSPPATMATEGSSPASRCRSASSSSSSADRRWLSSSKPCRIVVGKLIDEGQLVGWLVGQSRQSDATGSIDRLP